MATAMEASWRTSFAIPWQALKVQCEGAGQISPSPFSATDWAEVILTRRLRGANAKVGPRNIHLSDHEQPSPLQRLCCQLPVGCTTRSYGTPCCHDGRPRDGTAEGASQQTTLGTSALIAKGSVFGVSFLYILLVRPDSSDIFRCSLRTVCVELTALSGMYPYSAPGVSHCDNVRRSR